MRLSCAVIIALACALPAFSAAGQQPTDAPWPPPGVFPAGGPVSPPLVLQSARPEYTRAALERKLSGEVELEAVVDADGSVREVRVTRSLDAELGLDEQAIAAARRYRFSPGMRNGVPVPVLVRIIMDFNIRGSAAEFVLAPPRVEAGAVSFQVNFQTGMFDPAVMRLVLHLDTDENRSTGSNGVEYRVFIFSSDRGADVMRVAASGQSQRVGTVPVRIASDRAELTIPLTLLGNDDGSIHAQVSPVRLPPAGGNRPGAAGPPGPPGQ